MLNWHEEEAMRTITGEGRTQASGHIPKKRQDLFLKPGEELKEVYDRSVNQVPTSDRIFGVRREPSYNTENQEK